MSQALLHKGCVDFFIEEYYSVSHENEVYQNSLIGITLINKYGTGNVFAGWVGT